MYFGNVFLITGADGIVTQLFHSTKINLHFISSARNEKKNNNKQINVNLNDIKMNICLLMIFHLSCEGEYDLFFVQKQHRC